MGLPPSAATTPVAGGETCGEVCGIRQTVRVEQRAIRTLRPLWAPTPPCPRGESPGDGGGYGQGQLWRQPPGHEPCGIRRFLRDAVVFDDYAIHDGMVIPQGTIRVRYSPETCPELPQQLARLARGDTAAVLALSAPMGYWAMPRWPRPSAAVRTATHLGIP